MASHGKLWLAPVASPTEIFSHKRNAFSATKRIFEATKRILSHQTQTHLQPPKHLQPPNASSAISHQ